MRYRPFALIGADLLSAAQRLLEAAADEWCADWGLAREALTLACARAWEGEAHWPAAWRQAWRGEQGALSLAWTDELGGQLQRQMFAPDQRHAGLPSAAALAPAAAAAAWQDLLQRLAAVSVPGAARDDQPQSPPQADWEHASGALLLTLRLGRHNCHGLLNHGAVQALAQQAALRGLLQRASAAALPALDYGRLLADQPVRLPVEIGRAEVGLGSLLGLAVGDVIRLDVPADRALSIAGPSGQTLFGGYLGLKDETVALELVRQD